MTARLRPLAQVLLRKLLLAYVAFVLVISGIAVVIGYRNAQQEVLATLHTLVSTFAPVTEAALWEYQAPLLQAMADGLGTHSVVVRVEISDQTAKLQTTWNTKTSEQASPALTVLHTFYRKSDNSKLGSLMVASSEEQVLSRLKETLLTIATTAIALFLCLGVVLLMLLRALVVRPLTRFSEQVQALSETELRQPIALGRTHVAEINTLQNGFNGLMQQLAESHSRVAEQNAGLELRVAERTRALQEKETQLRAMFDEMPIGIFVEDAQERIFFRNRHFIEMVGYTEDDVPDLATWWTAAYPDPDYRAGAIRASQEVERTAADGRTTIAPSVYAVRCKNGEVRYFEISGVSTGYGLLSTFVDHTQHRLHQQQLEVAKAGAEAASQAKSDFLANMSHEIRTPMNGILGMLNLLEHTDLTKRQLDYASKAQTATQSLLGIINDILDFSKVEAGKMELEVSAFTPGEVMRDLSVILSANQGDKDVEVLIAMDPDIPPALLGDAMRLRQVLLNLAGNAVKFTEQGSVVVGIRVLGHTAQTIQLEFSVTDTGIGIPAEKLAFIFEGFSQAESSTTRRFGGTGLGLAISKRLVGLMGSELQVHSTPGQGSRFFFNAAFTVVPSQAADLHRTPLTHNSQPMRVLAVDDNAMAREVLHTMARSMGWMIDSLASGEEALARLQQAGGAPYQVILMDWRMPGMDGWETTRRIRQLKIGAAAPVVIMVSAHGRELLAEKSKRETDLFDAYLVKPVTASTLYDAVVDATVGRTGLPDRRMARAGSQRLQGLRLLVVEDNLLNQQVAFELLTRNGAQVDIAGGGIDGVACALAAEPPFDAVLMDLQMPDMGGLEATARIRSHTRMLAVPIIAMTANAMASDKEACRAAGMVDHVSKPIDLERLIAALLRHTGRSDPGPAIAPPASPVAAGEPDPGARGIDIDNAVKRLGGNRAFYDQISRSFQTDGSQQMTEMQQHVQHGRWVDATRCAHTLKGLAGTVGAMALASAAARTEAALKEQRGDMGDTLDRLQVQLSETLEQLMALAPRAAAEANARGVAGNRPLDPAGRQGASQALAELAELLQQNNMRSTLVCAELVTNFGAALGGRSTELAQSVNQLDFALAQRHCQALQQELIET